MTAGQQVVQVAARATSFTAACVECAALDVAGGFGSSTFAGRLELDLDHGTFLCRRGHTVRVERAAETAASPPSAEAAA